ncbi:class I SAM-dependent methyltransferase [Nioella nitratireducens]|uniref:class I SAM-dependent methyltransferase n=1 Tax=Nioella nitratireducens TaxID=1287720 RepID=UPI000A99FFC6|nr:class I SAM-dependent methyltransferase [Nioella nitratireducens]
MITAPAFWDKVATKYAASPIKDETAYEATLDRVRSHLRSGDRALELGCGTGTTALKLAPSVAYYVASDISGAMLDIARDKAWDAGARTLSFHQGAPGEGDLPEGPFDVVLAFNLLHLLPNLPAALRDIASRLPSGGLFLSKTPCLSGAMGLLRPVIGVMQLLGKAPEVKFFSPAALERQIEAAGFEIIEAAQVHKSNNRPFLAARKL